MMDFKTAVGILLSPQVEGDYSNNHNDPGGETRWGITKRTAMQNGYTGDMRILPKDVAIKIYLRIYWAPQRIDELPETVRYCVFDACVNEGVSRTVGFLRDALNLAEGGVDDEAVKAAQADDPLRLFAGLIARRVRHYTSLPTWGMFGRGWMNRIATNLEVVEKLGAM